MKARNEIRILNGIFMVILVLSCPLTMVRVIVENCVEGTLFVDIVDSSNKQLGLAGEGS